MDKEKNTFWVPQYLHRPYQVLFFETEELAGFLLAFFLALMFGGIFWIITFFTVFVLNYFKTRYPRGYLKHIFYTIGLIQFKGAPSSFEKKFCE